VACALMVVSDIPPPRAGTAWARAVGFAGRWLLSAFRAAPAWATCRCPSLSTVSTPVCDQVNVLPRVTNSCDDRCRFPSLQCEVSSRAGVKMVEAMKDSHLDHATNNEA
jgi:hypothetical protein